MQDGSFGLELLLDLYNCDLTEMSKEKLISFFKQLVNLLKMEAVGEPAFWEDLSSDEPHIQGISGIQWISTSNIVIHTLNKTNLVLLNIFSCSNFDSEEAKSFSANFFKASKVKSELITRGKSSQNSYRNWLHDHPRPTHLIFDHPNAGWDHDVARAAHFLIVGNKYQLDRTVMHSYSTDVYLKEFPGMAFNSVQFSSPE